MIAKKTFGSGHGYGKTILFGEHFVIYDLPGIVSALNLTLDCVVKPSTTDSHSLIDNTLRFKNSIRKTFTLNDAQERIDAVLKYLHINTPLHITRSGTLKIANSGMGASAADLVAFAKALNDLFELQLTLEQINMAAFEGEKIAHGNPSGIDNTAATYGGLFIFQKNNLITPITLKQPIEIVLAESGKSTPTPQVIAAVSKLKTEQPLLVQRIFNEYQQLVTDAQHALTSFDLVTVGKLMNKNHELLQQLTVSCFELDTMVAIALQAGALGAKLTGTGRGGLMVALTPGKDLQNNVAQCLEDVGFETVTTTIG